MSKELEALERLIGKKVFISLGRTQGKKQFANDINIIETALKEKEQQDGVLKILKEVIEFAKVLPHIEPNKDNDFNGIVSAVSINIQRDIENKERELLRKWVLETCFPKELQTLEIIIGKNVNVRAFKKVLLMEQNDDIKLNSYNSQNHRFEDDLTKEEFDLLREVLE